MCIRDSACTTLWTGGLCQALARAGRTGEHLTVLFGGPHQSLPSLLSAGVRPGDVIHPIRVFRQASVGARGDGDRV